MKSGLCILVLVSALALLIVCVCITCRSKNERFGVLGMQSSDVDLKVEEFETLLEGAMEKMFGIKVEANKLAIDKAVNCAEGLTSAWYSTTSATGSIDSEGMIEGSGLRSAGSNNLSIATNGGSISTNGGEINSGGGSIKAGKLTAMYDASTGEFNAGVETAPLMEGAQVYIANTLSKERGTSAVKEKGYGLLMASSDDNGAVYSADPLACVSVDGHKTPWGQWQIYSASNTDCSAAGN